MVESLESRVHHNLIEVSARMSAEVDRRDGELLFASRSPMPFLNGVIRESSNGDAGALLERAKDFFFGRERGFVAFTWPGDPDLSAAADSAGMFRFSSATPRWFATRHSATCVPIFSLSLM